MDMAARRRPRVFYGWWMVAAIATTMVYTGGTFFYGFTAFFNPILDEFGWSRAALSLAFSLYRMEAGPVGLLAGYLVDRFNPKWLMAIGAIMMGSAFILMSMVQDLWSFYATFILAATGLGFGWGPTPGAAVAQWFVRRLGRAMGFMMAGYGLSGAVIPGLVWLIDQVGWRQTLVILGVGLWAICLPLILIFVRRRPQDYGLLPDGDDPAQGGSLVEAAPVSGHEAEVPVSFGEVEFTWRQALRTPAFWLLVTAVGLGSITIAAMNVHLIPYLVTVNIPREVAGLIVTGLTLFSLVGRLGFGWLADFYNHRYLFAIAYIMMVVGVIIFGSIVEAWMIIPFLLTFGVGYGGPIPLRFAIQANYFGRQSFGTILGIMQFLIMLPGVVGPVYAGWIFDVTGSYRFAIYSFAAVTALAIPLILLARRPWLGKVSPPASGP